MSLAKLSCRDASCECLGARGSVSSAPGRLPAADTRPGEAVTLTSRNPLEDALWREKREKRSRWFWISLSACLSLQEMLEGGWWFAFCASSHNLSLFSRQEAKDPGI